MNKMVNLETLYTRASQDTLELGITWYARHRADLVVVAKKYHIPLASIAATVAVLSPGVMWDLVIKHLDEFIETGKGMPGYGKNLEKGKRALTGDLTVIRGVKVQAFYDNLVNPYSQRVTIDRWAYRAWLGDYAYMPKSSEIARVYTQVESDYKTFAESLGLQPCAFQAVVWVQVQQES